MGGAWIDSNVWHRESVSYIIAAISNFLARLCLRPPTTETAGPSSPFSAEQSLDLALSVHLSLPPCLCSTPSQHLELEPGRWVDTPVFRAQTEGDRKINNYFQLPISDLHPT